MRKRESHGVLEPCGASLHCVALKDDMVERVNNFFFFMVCQNSWGAEFDEKKEHCAIVVFSSKFYKMTQ